MKSNAVATALSLAESTLRKYATDYVEYLSPAGTGGGGRHRDYTEHDIRVLKLIMDMKRQKLAEGDIEITLQSLQDGGWDRLPALDASARALIPSPAASLAASADKSALEREIQVLREMLDKSDERAKDRDEQAQQRIDKVTTERDALLERLHRAEQLVELYESGRLKPPGA